MDTANAGPRSNRTKWLVAAAAVLVLLAIAGGILAALSVFGSDQVVDVGQLIDYDPGTITRVRARDGEVIAEFAHERRVLLTWDQIPPDLRNAIVAVEDAHFFEHSGINVRGILRAAVTNFRAGRVVEGGSSLTQQLAKVMFLTPERHFRRKVEEAVLALHLERSYSKEEILTFYCNQVYLGHNRYGVEAAARFYFGKHAAELDLGEAALIAGMPKKPSGYSPFRNYDAAIERRDHVLNRMAAVGSITEAEAETAKNTPPVLFTAALETEDQAPFFVEEVRKLLEARFGVKGLYHQGLDVHTTLDRDMQKAAERAVREGLLALDHRHGWRGASSNLLRDNPAVDLETWSHPLWSRPLEADGVVPGLVIGTDGGALTVRVGDLRATITHAPPWTQRRDVSSLHVTGDVGLFRVLAVDAEAGRLELAVEQEPQAEAALVAIDVRTGEVRAMVGGWDFARSRFNRAIQAQRQTGSAFKPLVYATALGAGTTPADSLFDEPIELVDESTGVTYAPENHGRQYHGLTTVREALEKSRNPLSVMLMQRVGAEAVIDTARRLGITAPLQPYPSMALGAFEINLMEMTSAYAAFADQGVLHSPYLVTRIEDRSANVLLRREPVSRPAVSPEVAFITTSLLEGVINNGTGRRAQVLGRTVAGKTGTTDGYTDAWFVGYSPSIACGVWVGHDQKRSLGAHEEGSRTALPIWIDFMDSALAGPDESFRQPANVELVRIDRHTGLRATDACQDTFLEVFLRGTAPAEYCSAREHDLRAMPYYMQKLYLAEAGSELADSSLMMGGPEAGLGPIESDSGDGATVTY